VGSMKWLSCWLLLVVGCSNQEPIAGEAKSPNPVTEDATRASSKPSCADLEKSHSRCSDATPCSPPTRCTKLSACAEPLCLDRETACRTACGEAPCSFDETSPLEVVCNPG
jgi:hypothetical protein